MSFSGLCCHLALASLLLLPSHGNGHPRPFAAPNQLFGFWNRENAMLQPTLLYHKALNYLGKEHSTYHAAPGEKNIHGQIYQFRTTVVKVKCPEEQKRVTLKDCEIIPGSPKYLCNLEMVTIPAFKIHNINILGCKELPTSTSSPVSSVEGNEREEGTPYMR